MVASGLRNLNFAEIAIIVAGIGYVVSLIKDWRPVRALRADNHELRKQLVEAERKIAALEAEVHALQKATNLTALHDDHKKIAEMLDTVADTLKHLDQSVNANTAAIEVVARGSAIKQALEDEGSTT